MWMLLGVAVFLLGDRIVEQRFGDEGSGGALAMLTNSLTPFAYERGGEMAGAATVVGCCVSLAGT